MAMTLEIRRATPITFTDATVIELRGVDAARQFILYETDVKVWLVHSRYADITTDGGARPTMDARPFPAATTLAGIALPPREFLGICASGAGTALIEFAERDE